MYLIVGLGNPGKQYYQSRHNAGFLVIEALAHELKIELNRKKFETKYGVGEVHKHKIVLAQPCTYMNNSGIAIQKLCKYYKITLKEILIICDDFNLPLGQLRIRPQGSAGGHNGLESIIQYLGTDHWLRVRLGIGTPDGSDKAEYVLAKFKKEELPLVQEMIAKATEAVIFLLRHSLEKTMTKYNSQKGK